MLFVHTCLIKLSMSSQNWQCSIPDTMTFGGLYKTTLKTAWMFWHGGKLYRFWVIQETQSYSSRWLLLACVPQPLWDAGQVVCVRRSKINPPAIRKSFSKDKSSGSTVYKTVLDSKWLRALNLVLKEPLDKVELLVGLKESSPRRRGREVEAGEGSVRGNSREAHDDHGDGRHVQCDPCKSREVPHVARRGGAAVIINYLK